MEIQQLPISEVHPHPDNPRHNDAGVAPVAASLERFGWQQPIVVDAERVIVVGHTRYKAALSLDMDTVPVVVADNLTPDECTAYRLADNRSGEYSTWDYELAAAQLQELASTSDELLRAAAFSEEDLQNLLNATWEPPPKDPAMPKRTHLHSVQFNEEQWESIEAALVAVNEAEGEHEDAAAALVTICEAYTG